MTLEEMKRLDRDTVTVREAAEVLGCTPQLLRDGMDLDDERPIYMRRYLFPHIKTGNRHSIARAGFIAWAEGRLDLNVTVSGI